MKKSRWHLVVLCLVAFCSCSSTLFAGGFEDTPEGRKAVATIQSLEPGDIVIVKWGGVLHTEYVGVSRTRGLGFCTPGIYCHWLLEGVSVADAPAYIAQEGRRIKDVISRSKRPKDWADAAQKMLQKVMPF